MKIIKSYWLRMSWFKLPLERVITLIACLLLVLNAFGSLEDIGDTTFRRSATMEWDETTRIKVATPADGKSYAGYARLIELEGTKLLCVYESAGCIWGTFSNDNGKSWGQGRIIVEKESGINMAVPDIMKLKNGNLLLLYNARPFNIDPTRHFGIRIKLSHDNGETWENAKEVYTAGYQFENGCWEPSAIQLPDGTVQLFFANEGIYTTSDEQNISMLTSTDNGESWSPNPKIISFRAGKRDGMPVPLLLKDHQVVAVAIEDNGFINFKPYIITNSLKENWKKTVLSKSNNRSYALATPLEDKVYAGAPYLRQLSTGETILSYQGTEGRRSNSLNDAIMKVAVGNNQARQFASVTEPFVIPQGKSGLWNSVAILKDDTVIALTSTNAFGNGAVEVWMIKGKLIR